MQKQQKHRKSGKQKKHNVLSEHYVKQFICTVRQCFMYDFSTV